MTYRGRKARHHQRKLIEVERRRADDFARGRQSAYEEVAANLAAHAPHRSCPSCFRLHPVTERVVAGIRLIECPYMPRDAFAFVVPNRGPRR